MILLILNENESDDFWSLAMMQPGVYNCDDKFQRYFLTLTTRLGLSFFFCLLVFSSEVVFYTPSNYIV